MIRFVSLTSYQVRQLLVICVFAWTGICEGQRVIQITWPTTHASQPPSLDETQRRWLMAAQFAAAGLPEETLLSMGLSQGQLIGLESAESKRLQTLFVNYYARVRSMPWFQATPSSLPYCFSASKPTNGLATIYVPAKITTSTRTILFVHGFGGSLLGYLHFMANTFSNDIVICPAYGVEPASISPAYLTEALSV